MDKVSVIIPTYNRSCFLSLAIESVLDQTYKNLEIVVIDDNCQNIEERKASRDIVQNYKNKIKIIYLENKNNLGGALSRNEGIKAATGKFISFLDDDDRYEPTKIEKQLKYYNIKFNNKTKGFIFCQQKMIDEKNKIIPTFKNKIIGNNQALFEVLKTGITSTGCIFLPKEILLEVGGFEKLICGQEWFLTLKILLKGYECYSMSEELLIYNNHSQERITNSQKKIEGEKILYEIKKKYISLFSEAEQKELHYFNNIELARLCFEFKNKEGIEYIKSAIKYKKILFRDILKLSVNYLFSNNLKNKLKQIIIKN